MLNKEDPHDLKRFVYAQESSYKRALEEVKKGQKQSHWMWYIFPQFDGLGESSMCKRYAIKSLGEARAYLEHPILGPRLIECFNAALSVEGRSAYEIFGYPDNSKLKSCATLFAVASQKKSEKSVFDRLIDKYFQGEQDYRTLDILGKEGKESPLAER